MPIGFIGAAPVGSRKFNRCFYLSWFFCVAARAQVALGASPPEADTSGVVHLPAMSVPESSLLSEETRAALKATRAEEAREAAENCLSIEPATSRARAVRIHRCQENQFKTSAFYTKLRRRYPVIIQQQTIDGVRVEIFTPANGVSAEGRNRVLINLHGGGFFGGWGTNNEVESIPVASVAGVKVISVDYREAPESIFPAASEDVVKVYRSLLETYPPRNIGMFGCSAGALLGAESIAFGLERGLPVPGALGLFCGGAGYYSTGDSGYIGGVIYGDTVAGRMTWAEPAHDNPYFKNVDAKNPLAFPITSLALMAKFPPALVIAGIRDPALSSAVHTHAVLVSQGVAADLHVWEGLGHAFFYDIDLPESRDVYAIVGKFFNANLGR